MPLIDKEYFSLDELASGCWRLSRADLFYLVTEAKLRLSVRLFGVLLEMGAWEEVDEGRSTRIPSRIAPFDGLQDLNSWDAYSVLRDGSTEVDRFHAEGKQYCEVAQDWPPVRVREADLLVRRSARDRFEVAHGLSSSKHDAPARSASDLAEAYRFIQVGERLHVLGPIQARIVKLLHEAALTAAPWRPGKSLLAQANSTSIRMVDVFKSQPHWRELIASDKRGNYRLRVVCELPDLVGDSPHAVVCRPEPDNDADGAFPASSHTQRRRA